MPDNLQELLGAVDQIIHLHMQEQEGIHLPSSQEWIDAVLRLGNARRAMDKPAKKAPAGGMQVGHSR